MDPIFIWEYPCPEVTLVAFSTFSVAFISSIFVYFSTPYSNRKILMGTSCAIHLLAAISYLLMHGNLIPQVILNSDMEKPYVMLRPFEWLISVPLMITLIGELVRAPPREIETAKFRTMAVMITGGLGPLFRYPWNYVLFTVSCAYHVYVMYKIHELFDSIRSKLDSTFERRKVFLLNFVLLTLFSAYPIVWVLSVELRWLSLEMEMIIFSGLDMSAKILLTSILGNLSATAYELDLVSYPAESMLQFVEGLQLPTFALTINGGIVYWTLEMERLSKVKLSNFKPYIYASKNSELPSIFDFILPESKEIVDDLLNKNNSTELADNRRAKKVSLKFRSLGDKISIPFHIFSVSPQIVNENPPRLVCISAPAEANQDVQYFTNLAYAYSQATNNEKSN